MHQEKLRISSYNIHHGADYNENYTLPKIIKMI